jgi:HAE1 family hydrophobic/amphiphilic exporter-1
MARAIAGGLAFSTSVSLLFLPTIYAMLVDIRHATSRVLAKARGTRRDGGVAGATVAAIAVE